jgi:hypothetical protein
MSLLLAGAAVGQEPPRPPAPPQPAPRQPTPPQPAPHQPAPAQAAPAPPPRAPEYVEEKGFKGKVFELKNRNPEGLWEVLRPLGSGFKGATMSTNREFRTITVRDFPENIAAIEEAIKRLDVPEAAQPPQPSRPDVEFHVHVLIATDAPAGPQDLPAELTDVVKQLQATLRYKGYSLMTSSVQRAKDRAPGVSSSGVVDPKLFSVSVPPGNPIFYRYHIGGVSLEPTAAGPSRVQLGRFDFNVRLPLPTEKGVRYEDVGFSTPVGLREGEKVVVGTTTMGDKGLVVALSVKVIK